MYLFFPHFWDTGRHLTHINYDFNVAFRFAIVRRRIWWDLGGGCASQKHSYCAALFQRGGRQSSWNSTRSANNAGPHSSERWASTRICTTDFGQVKEVAFLTAGFAMVNKGD